MRGHSLGALPVTLTSDGPGVYRADAVIVPFAGPWRLRLTIRSDAFNETAVDLPVLIR